MKEQYIIISQKKIDMIVDIKNVLEDELNSYLQILIKHFLEDDTVQFQNSDIQDDIADLLEKHEISVR